MTTLDGFASLIFNIYEAFTVAIFLKDKDHLVCHSSVTFAGSFDKDRVIPVDGTLPGWVIKHGEPLIIPNFDKDETTLGYYGSSEDIKSFMGYPMEDNGVIIVDSKKKWVFTDKEKKILGAFADMIDEEIERGKHYSNMEEMMEELTVERKVLSLFNELNQSMITVGDIIRECLSFCGADFSFVGVEKDRKLLIKDLHGIDGRRYINKECPSGQCVAAIVAEGGRELLLPHDSNLLKEKALFFPGETIRARQFFGFPLLADDITMGVAGFVSLSDKPLKEKAIGFLRNISAFLSLYYASVWTRENLEKLKELETVTDSIQFPVFIKISDGFVKKGRGFSLISVRIPNIDLCNRRMGYEFTDNLLKRVFYVIKNCVNNHAFITRKGGGHFYILLKRNSRLDAAKALKIMYYSLIKCFAEEKVSDILSSVFTGAAFFPEDSNDLWGLFEKADSEKDKGNQ